MAYYSILYQSIEQEKISTTHPWVRFTGMKKSKYSKYIMHGNKYIPNQINHEEFERAMPSHVIDLNLDQVIDSILNRDIDEPLRNYFYDVVKDESLLTYRQEIMKDLECEDINSVLKQFIQSVEMAIKLEEYSNKSHYPAQKDKYYLDGMYLYFQCIHELCHKIDALPTHSQGLKLFLNEVKLYGRSESFKSLYTTVERVKYDADQIKYKLHFLDNKIELSPDVESDDYIMKLNNDIECESRWNITDSFEKHEIGFFRQVELCPLEIRIMDKLRNLYAPIFLSIHKLVSQSQAYMQPFILRFCQEAKFYLRYIDFMQILKRKGFTFTYPVISNDHSVFVEGLCDIALACKADCVSQVVTNDICLNKEEECIVITGANQGGKTTLARGFGQLAAITAMGFPVLCTKAILPLYHEIFTQFSEKEDSTVNDGKLKEELTRLKPIMKSVSKNSLVILNELFSSTTSRDAFEMGSQVLKYLTKAGAFVVCVTHIPELSTSCENTVSMVAQIQESDGKRTYKIVRANADGLAHTKAIASKYRLTYEDIKERIRHEV